MTKTALKNFTAEIARKRREVSRLRETLGDMLDHLAVIETRVKSAGGKDLRAVLSPLIGYETGTTIIAP